MLWLDEEDVTRKKKKKKKVVVDVVVDVVVVVCGSECEGESEGESETKMRVLLGGGLRIVLLLLDLAGLAMTFSFLSLFLLGKDEMS